MWGGGLGCFGYSRVLLLGGCGLFLLWWICWVALGVLVFGLCYCGVGFVVLGFVCCDCLVVLPRFWVGC